ISSGWFSTPEEADSALRRCPQRQVLHACYTRSCTYTLLYGLRLFKEVVSMDVGQHTSFTGRTQEESVAMPITTTVLGTLLAGLVFIFPNLAQADQDLETAKLLIKMVELGRGVISEQQTLINDSTRSDKGVTADFVTSQIADRFKKQTNIDLAIPNSHPSIKLLQTMLESQKEVMDGAQPMINKQGVGFKAFLPATFARRTGAAFYKKTGIQVKLTSIAYRYDGNKPDEFEQEV